MTAQKTAGGEATRQHLIEASYRLFTSRGYHATSMRDIAAEAGITAGSIYNHFSDKEQIFKAVALAYHPVMRVLPVLEDVEGHTVSEIIRDAAHRMIHEIDAAPGILNLMYIEFIELEGKHIQELVGQMFPLVQGFLNSVYQKGEKLRPRDPLTFFRAFLGMVLGYGVTRAAAAKLTASPAIDASLDEFVDLFLQGVLEE